MSYFFFQFIIHNGSENKKVGKSPLRNYRTTMVFGKIPTISKQSMQEKNQGEKFQKMRGISAANPASLRGYPCLRRDNFQSHIPLSGLDNSAEKLQCAAFNGIITPLRFASGIIRPASFSALNF